MEYILAMLNEHAERLRLMIEQNTGKPYSMSSDSVSIKDTKERLRQTDLAIEILSNQKMPLK